MKAETPAQAAKRRQVADLNEAHELLGGGIRVVRRVIHRSTERSSRSLAFGKEWWIFSTAITPETDEEWTAWRATLDLGPRPPGPCARSARCGYNCSGPRPSSPPCWASRRKHTALGIPAGGRCPSRGWPRPGPWRPAKTPTGGVAPGGAGRGAWRPRAYSRCAATTKSSGERPTSASADGHCGSEPQGSCEHRLFAGMYQ